MDKKEILYVFGGEKSSGAEYVIENLIRHNTSVNSHLVMSPGRFYDKLSAETLPYKLAANDNLKKLNTQNSGKIKTLLLFIKSVMAINSYVYKYIKKNNITIVHTNTIVPTTYLLPVAIYSKLFWKKVKFIWSDHDITYVHGILGRLLSFIYKIYDRTIVVSNAVAKKYHDKTKLNILYNGLDPNKIIVNELSRSTFREKHNIPNNVLAFSIIGQIVDRKGVNGLIDTFRQVYPPESGVWLIIAGMPIDADSPYYAAFLQKIEDVSNIKYIGFCDNIDQFYNGADIVINNSTHTGQEPLGTTIIEGLGYSRIVMATNVGGSSEMIENSVNGFLYEDSPEALKSTLVMVKDIIENRKDEFDLMRKHARSTFIKKFELSKMSANYNTIVQSL
ncbi:glycosyltransferase family 4 protein [Flavobacterium psychrotrophum]|uniref:glycosyltransferase family 4 protein n=1 Tax=Flavobacterium psychrotrophum TaxID=2294119 RepID=UPI000E30EAC1|nr:glycosyltransferase family 4 protein [Flavobacterium psychrotrophum]